MRNRLLLILALVLSLAALLAGWGLMQTDTPSASSSRASVERDDMISTRRVSDGSAIAASPQASATPAASGGVAPAIHFNPDEYASTSALIADAGTIRSPAMFRASEDTPSNTTLSTWVALDTTTAPPGYSQSMRYTWRAVDAGGNFAFGRYIYFEDHDVSPLPTEVWIEWWNRVGVNFDANGSGSGNIDYKWAFLLTNTDERIDVHLELFGESIDLEAPSGMLIGELSPMSIIQDDEWHRCRLHVRRATSAGANDGVITFWIDDTLVASSTTMASPKQGQYQRWAFGANMNRGPNAAAAPFSLWWGGWKLYTTDPGW